MNTTTLTLHEGYFAKRNPFDWLFAALVVAGGLFAFFRSEASGRAPGAAPAALSAATAARK